MAKQQNVQRSQTGERERLHVVQFVASEIESTQRNQAVEYLGGQVRQPAVAQVQVLNNTPGKRQHKSFVHFVHVAHYISRQS